MSQKIILSLLEGEKERRRGRKRCPSPGPSVVRDTACLGGCSAAHDCTKTRTDGLSEGKEPEQGSVQHMDIMWDFFPEHGRAAHVASTEVQPRELNATK